MNCIAGERNHAGVCSGVLGDVGTGEALSGGGESRVGVSILCNCSSGEHPLGSMAVPSPSNSHSAKRKSWCLGVCSPWSILALVPVVYLHNPAREPGLALTLRWTHAAKEGFKH